MMSSRRFTMNWRCLRHPCIIKLIDQFENSEYIFLVFEYIKDTLADLTKVRTLAEDEMGIILLQLISGINYMHKYGIIHKDIRPENIVLTEIDGLLEVKFTNFGCCEIMRTDKQDNFDYIKETVHYKAPEIIKKESYDTGVDIWSLGILLYKCYSGVYPFHPEELEMKITSKRYRKQVKEKIKTGVFSILEKWENLKSKELMKLIIKCLKINSKERIDIDELNNDKFIVHLKEYRNKNLDR